MKRPIVAVAVSGGADSTALWHATSRVAANFDLDVIGLHVHHGLQPQADDWLHHLERQARRWAAGGLPVRLVSRRLGGAPAGGESVEAWARRERYAALAEMAQQCGAGLVLLAHHRRDQAETFLLQAMRGAGPAGLAAMPREAERSGIVWARPWLDQPRAAIDAYLRRHRLRHVEDASNRDDRFARSRLRRHVLPVLEQQFEQAAATLAACARRAHEAALCLRELADLDAERAVAQDGRLDLSAWCSLSTPRRANLLRVWLARQGSSVPESLVQRLLQELPGAASGSCWPWHAQSLRVHGGRLQRVEARHHAASVDADGLPVDLSRTGRVLVPQWGGSFEVLSVEEGGIEPQRLSHCELRARRGGERFQRAVGTPPRSLKKQYQLAGVPDWQRGGPLVYALGGLVFVPGLGIDIRRRAQQGVPMLDLRWCPDPPPS